MSGSVEVLRSFFTMSITGGLISFGVRYAFNVSADHVVAVIEKRLTDHSQALPKALSKANDRAWEAVGLALAGNGLGLPPEK